MNDEEDGEENEMKFEDGGEGEGEDEEMKKDKERR